MDYKELKDKFLQKIIRGSKIVKYGSLDEPEEWTKFMQKLIHDLGTNNHYDCICKERYRHMKESVSSDDENEEYLTIDYLWFENNEKKEDHDFILPYLAIEHENNERHQGNEDVEYSFWKLASTRTKLRFLISYPKGNLEKLLEEWSTRINRYNTLDTSGILIAFAPYENYDYFYSAPESYYSFFVWDKGNFTKF